MLNPTLDVKNLIFLFWWCLEEIGSKRQRHQTMSLCVTQNYTAQLQQLGFRDSLMTQLHSATTAMDL